MKIYIPPYHQLLSCIHHPKEHLLPCLFPRLPLKCRLTGTLRTTNYDLCIADCYAKCVVHSGRQSVAFVMAGIKVHIDNFSFYRIVIAVLYTSFCAISSIVSRFAFTNSSASDFEFAVSKEFLSFQEPCHAP